MRTPRGTFHVTDMSREQMEAAGYGFHHESEDGKYIIMANGSRAFAIPNGDTPEHTAPEKLTVLVVEPMKEPYVKEIDPGLHALQAEVGGDIAASYPFDDPVGLVLNDEGKLIGLDLNRSLRDEHGEIYDIVAGTFLVVGLGPESFASLPPDMIQKYTEQFKRPELFASINGQIVSVPVEPENPLRTAEMTLEDDYGMIDGIINNGRRGEELEKAQAEARRTTPEKKPSIRERLEDAKRECAEQKGPDKPAPQKKPPELAGVPALVDVALLIQLGEDLLAGLHVVVVGGADEAVVADVHQLPQIFDGGDDLIHVLLGGHACVGGLVLDLLAVLVGAGQEHDVVALHPLEACQCVAGHGGVAVADVQLVAGIINRCGDVECLVLAHENDSSFLLALTAKNAPALPAVPDKDESV